MKLTIYFTKGCYSFVPMKFIQGVWPYASIGGVLETKPLKIKIMIPQSERATVPTLIF